MFTECIKEGFRLTHRNWQLIIVRLAVSFINLISLGFFLVIPVIVAIFYLGFDLAHAKDIPYYIMNNPMEYASRYLGLIFLIFAAIIMYLVFSSFLLLYILSGTLGVLKSSAVDEVYRFRLSLFFKEAGKNFAGLFWLISSLMAGFMVIMILFAFIGGAGWTVTRSIGDTGMAVEVFLKYFITSAYFIFGIIFLFATLVLAAFSITVSVVEGSGTMESIKRAYYFLIGRPGAFIFYMILLAVLLFTNFVFVSFSIIPFISPLINVVLQKYLTVVVWSSLFVYYMKNTNHLTPGKTHDIHG